MLLAARECYHFNGCGWCHRSPASAHPRILAWIL